MSIRLPGLWSESEQLQRHILVDIAMYRQRLSYAGGAHSFEDCQSGV